MHAGGRACKRVLHHNTHTCTHTLPHTHARTHARARAHTHTHHNHTGGAWHRSRFLFRRGNCKRKSNGRSRGPRLKWRRDGCMLVLLHPGLLGVLLHRYAHEKCSRNQSSKSCHPLIINSPANHCARQVKKDVRCRGQIVAKRWLRAEVAPAWYKWRALHETKIRLAAACDKIVRRWRHRPLSMCMGAWHERLCKMRRAALLMRNSRLAAGWRRWSFNVQELVRRTRLLAKACNRGFIKHRRALTLAVEVAPAQLDPCPIKH